jgi:hypothetical protein
MALYINDPEVSRLASDLSRSTGASKTDIVRRLLREEARRIERIRTAPERLRRLRQISREAGKIAKRRSLTYTKQDADEMFAYLDAEAQRAVRVRTKRKAG